MKPKPFGILLGLAGNVAIAIALYHLIQTGSCGGRYATPCPSSDTPYFLMLPGGIVLSVISIFLGGGAPAFCGTFLAVGLGSLASGIWGDNEDTHTFALVFGGIFTAVSLTLLIGAVAMIPWRRSKQEKAQRLIATGGKAVGTIVDVSDTGVTINDNPRVRIRMHIEPQDGTPAFEGEKTVTVSRIAIPQIGQRFPVWYDRADHATWAYGTEMAPAQVQFAQPFAAAPQPPRPDPLGEIARLNELRMQGAITDQEFQTAKDRLLGQIGGATP